MKSIYIIGSLRNPQIQVLQSDLTDAGYDAFASWYCAGPEADDYWQAYEKARGLSFEQARRDYAAQHVFKYDRSHLDRCDYAVLAMPAGKSGHLELGYFIGKGKPGFILLDGEPDRWDAMYAFAHRVVTSVQQLIVTLDRNPA